MPTDHLTFARFSVELMERGYSRMIEATEGLTDEQLYYQPAPGSNSIGWLVWHLSRFKDIQTGRVAGELQVWVTGDWAARFGLPEDVHGMRDGPEQVSAFRADRQLLMGYAEAAHLVAVRRVQSVESEQLERPVQSFDPSRTRPAWEYLLINAIDYTEHTGQIAYLRGALTGPGWMKTMPYPTTSASAPRV